MKKSFMSISMLVVAISMLALFVCTSAVSAQSSSKFVYNKSDNAEIVYTLDNTGKLLTPKLKYEYTQSKDNKSTTKVAFRWDAKMQTWTPYYLLSLLETGTDSTIEYAAWDDNTKEFSSNLQKTVYSVGLDNELLSYVSYNWNQKAGSWEVNQHLLLEQYFAMGADSLN